MSAREELRFVRLDRLTEVFRPGSGDWGWSTEYDHLIAESATQRLVESIVADGIREPILLGADGRVWDGHHRIVAAMCIGLYSVPVRFSGEAEPTEQRVWVRHPDGTPKSNDEIRIEAAVLRGEIESEQPSSFQSSGDIESKRPDALPFEPTEAQVKAALDAWAGKDFHATYPGSVPFWEQRMRVALKAAFAAREGGA